ncbi:MAG: hypothetical protein JJ911_17995 [Rhizobiaceae bacterium]|nr:hypothetical protein [Rhizobiaceae bacterium]
METSIWIAKLLGPVVLAVSIPMIVSLQLLRELAREFLKSTSLIFMSGILVMVGGLAIVNAHNRWNLDWTLLITLFGWAMVIGGAFRVIAPKFVAGIGESTLDRTAFLRGSVMLWAVFGLVLTYYGYF